VGLAVAFLPPVDGNRRRRGGDPVLNLAAIPADLLRDVIDTIDDGLRIRPI
jgi:hypothetical protein